MKIYHYTSLQSLVSIISRKQLRLIRLDEFVNLYEPTFFSASLFVNNEIKNRFEDLYISSWTTDPEESISTWKLFSSLDNGVRIGIDTENIFNGSDSCGVEIYALGVWGNGQFKVKSPQNKMYLSKVQYISNQDIISGLQNECNSDTIEAYRKYREFTDSIISFSCNKLTALNEIRLQVKVNRTVQPYAKKALQEYEKGLNNDNSISFIIAKLPEFFFRNLEVLVSPNFSDENIYLLNSFLCEQGIYTEVQKSALTKIVHSYIWHQSRSEKINAFQ